MLKLPQTVAWAVPRVATSIHGWTSGSTMFVSQGRACVVILRTHVTSSRDSAGATLTPEAAFENIGSLSKVERSRPRQLKLPSNMKFTLCPSEFFDQSSSYAPLVATDHTQASSQALAQRPLILLFGWMLSQDKHIEKYRKFWYARGFDVLTVRTPPQDLLLPTIGGARNARIIYDYLQAMRPRYDEIVVHAFSVGGYQLGEFLRRLETFIREGDEQAVQLAAAFKGQIIDSCVFAEDCAPGLSNAITKNKVVQPLIEKSINSWLKVTRRFTMNRYKDVQTHLFDNQRRVPGLVFYSNDDIVSSVPLNQRMFNCWKRAGLLALVKNWEKSVHVMHYREHQEEYETCVDKFLAELPSLTKNKKLGI